MLKNINFMYPVFYRVKLLVSFILLLLIYQISAAQTKSTYPVKEITSELLQDAHVVVRKDHRSMTVPDRGQAHLKVEKVLTILDGKGASQAPVYVYHDQYQQISNLQCTIYDAEGNVLKRVHPKDFGDYPAVNEAPLYEKLRFLVFNHIPEQYPYTIACSYELAMDGFYQFPTWSPVRSEGVSVEQAAFHLKIARGLNLRYKSFNLGEESPTIRQTKEATHYSWQVQNFSAVYIEALGPDFYQLSPTLLLSPVDFAYQNNEGSGESWQSFGQWVYQLLQTQDSLSLESRNQVRQLVANAETPYEKVALVFDYVRQQTRTVNLPLGVGTYQPVSAEEVARSGYGDSKALSNYLIVLLEEIGIKGYYTLVNAGKFATSIDTEMPGSQFNRAIVTVPLDTDTLWLDCSQNHLPAGYLGYELSNRQVLVVTEQGGELCMTPSYSVDDNLQARVGTIVISQDGTAQVDVSTTYSGLQYAHTSPITMLPPDQQETVILQKTNIDKFDLLSFQYHNKKGKTPQIDEHLTLKVKRFADPVRNTLTFVPNIMNQMDGLPPIVEQRSQPVIVRRSFTDRDRWVYELPEHQKIQLPEDVFINTKFGVYRMEVHVEAGKLIYERFLQTYQGTFPSSAYSQLLAFYEDIIMSDQRKVMLYGVKERETDTIVSAPRSLE